jgi:heterodisulfide reductase subunit A-like polyferredoxin
MNTSLDDSVFCDFLVVGGGVAGVCAVEELDSLLGTSEFIENETPKICFVSGSSGFIKKTVDVKAVG